MDQISDTTVRFGITPSLNFAPTGQQTDWNQTPVTFGSPFGPPKPFLTKGVPQEISVVATAIDPIDVAPVVVIKNVTSGGFTLFARNARDKRGETRFAWLAVLGNPDPAGRVPLDLRFGSLQPKVLGSTGKFTDWPGVWYSDPINDPNRVQLLTENNVGGASRSDIAWNNAAAVGMVVPISGSASPTPAPQDAFAVGAVNVDTTDGRAGFYWLGIGRGRQREVPSSDDFWLDHGSERGVEDSFKYNAVSWPAPPNRRLAPGGTSGDWLHLDVYFEHPFLTPPIVLLTARDNNPDKHGHNPLVAIAQNVGTHGFTAALRNTDSGGAMAEFYWIAVGTQADGG